MQMITLNDINSGTIAIWPQEIGLVTTTNDVVHGRVTVIVLKHALPTPDPIWAIKVTEPFSTVLERIANGSNR